MTDPRFEIRPLGLWDRERTRERMSSGQFKAKWSDTITMLKRETEYLGAQVVVCQIDVTEGEIRRDGMLKVGARVGFPGVKISFDSVHGPLTYATDQYDKLWPGAMPGWQANVRAITLGLQALRAVDRYGITRSGEQYRGWQAISDKPAAHDDLTMDDAVLIFADATEVRPDFVRGFADVIVDSKRSQPFVSPESVTESKMAINRLYRIALKKRDLHPDRGGDEQVFKLVTRARDVLLAGTR